MRYRLLQVLTGLANFEFAVYVFEAHMNQMIHSQFLGNGFQKNDLAFWEVYLPWYVSCSVSGQVEHVNVVHPSLNFETDIINVSLQAVGLTNNNKNCSCKKDRQLIIILFLTIVSTTSNRWTNKG